MSLACPHHPLMEATVPLYITHLSRDTPRPLDPGLPEDAAEVLKLAHKILAGTIPLPREIVDAIDRWAEGCPGPSWLDFADWLARAPAAVLDLPPRPDDVILGHGLEPTERRLLEGVR